MYLFGTGGADLSSTIFFDVVPRPMLVLDQHDVARLSIMARLALCFRITPRCRIAGSLGSMKVRPT